MAQPVREYELYAADLFGELHLAEAQALPPRRAGGLRALWPGLVLCGVAAGAAAAAVAVGRATGRARRGRRLV